MDVQVVPAKTTAEEILAMKPDGIFLSNGPADPSAVTYAVENIAELIGKLPLMGICLGRYRSIPKIANNPSAKPISSFTFSSKKHIMKTTRLNRI